jgi:PAS domain S-box-containing protein
MKNSDNVTEKISKKKIRLKKELGHGNEVLPKHEDVKTLIHLLEVHQVELEHQNQELRLTQEELEISRNKYVNLFDFAPIPYFTLDQNGIIKEVNLSASKLLRVDRNKLIGKVFDSFIPRDEKEIFRSFLRTIFNSNEKHSSELKFINKDNQVFNVLLEGLELVDTLEPIKKCQVAVIDLTEYKKNEASLKKFTEELKSLNDAKDKFFSIISHDLRSAFQSLLSPSELLSTQIEDLSQQEIIDLSRGLYDNLKTAYGLLENLLNWSMMQRNNQELKPSKIKLWDEVNRITKMLNQSAVNKNITLKNKINQEILVNCDANMLHSVFQNLITNGIKYSETGGVITISANEKKDFVEVSIEDSGIGMELDQLSKIFKFNSMSSTDGTMGERGTGLGLILCKEFIEKSNGKIWVDSEMGKGAKFSFTLQKKG